MRDHISHFCMFISTPFPFDYVLVCNIIASTGCRLNRPLRLRERVLILAKVSLAPVSTLPALCLQFSWQLLPA